MKIILLILLTSCTLLYAEYPRHKVRGPPHSSRIPPSKQFSKKWYQQTQHPPPRGPIRSRPIPVHMPPSHKIPMGGPKNPPRTVSLPVRTFWKNTQSNNIKLPQEKPYLPPQEKPFLVAPSINTQELDYHIQTNSIPTTHTNPIKQIGEKGPIHTIPAPNLSLKDKPIVVEEIKYQVKAPYKNVNQNHQYQVTEQPEGMTKSKVYRGQHQLIQQQHQVSPQQMYQQQLHLQQQMQKQQQIEKQQQEHQLQLQQQYLQQQQKQVEIQPQQFYYTTDPQNLNVPVQNDPQGNIYMNPQLGSEIYKLIGATYPQQPQEVKVQEPQQSFYQPQKQTPNYQALLAQQLFQPEQQNFEQSDQGRQAGEKVNFAPEFQSFNYDEQAHQKSLKGLSKEQLSSLVTAAYSLDSNVPVIESRNSVDPLAQAQLIQSYFDTRSDVEENDVEPDAKPSTDQKSQPDKVKEELLSSSYFSSLPNKEAAERLAHLQAAGKINSNLMKISSDDQGDARKEDEMEEEEESDERSNENYSDSNSDAGVDYEEYSQENENTSSEERARSFGDRLVHSREN